jgi:hypothetical protein
MEDREWRCSCGVSFGEPGDGSGWLEIKRHQMGQAGHKIYGLYASPSDDAECLVAGPKKSVAIDLGYMVDPKPPKTETKASGGSSTKESKEGKANDNNMLIGIPFAKLNPPPAIWGWISMTMPKLRNDLNQPYAGDNEGISQFVYDCVEFVGRYVLALEFRTDMDSAFINHIAQKLRGEITTRDLGGEVSMEVPDIVETNTEEVIADVLAAIKSQTRTMVDNLREGGAS